MGIESLEKQHLNVQARAGIETNAVRAHLKQLSAEDAPQGEEKNHYVYRYRGRWFLHLATSAPVFDTAPTDNTNDNDESALDEDTLYYYRVTLNQLNTLLGINSLTTLLKTQQILQYAKRQDMTEVPMQEGQFFTTNHLQLLKTASQGGGLGAGSSSSSSSSSSPLGFSDDSKKPTNDSPKDTISDWRVMANSAGVGFAVWSAVEIFLKSAAANELSKQVMAYLCPPLAAVLIGYVNYHSQIKRYEALHPGEKVPKKTRNQYFQDSLDLTLKMAFAIGGWTVGYEVLAPLLEAVLKAIIAAADLTFGAGAEHAVAAISVGLGMAIFLTFSAVMIEIKNQYKASKGSDFNLWEALKKINWYEMGKLFLIGFAAGSTWYLVSIIPFDTFLKGLGFQGLFMRFAQMFLESGTTYLVINRIFKQNKLEEEKWGKENQMPGVTLGGKILLTQGYTPGPGGMTRAFVTAPAELIVDGAKAAKRTVLG